MILHCEFSDKINSFILDSINNYIFILLDNGMLEVVQPKMSSHNKDLNSCEST